MTDNLATDRWMPNIDKTDPLKMYYSATGNWLTGTPSGDTAVALGSDLTNGVDRLFFNIGKPSTTNLGDALSGLTFTIGSSET